MFGYGRNWMIVQYKTSLLMFSGKCYRRIIYTVTLLMTQRFTITTTITKIEPICIRMKDAGRSQCANKQQIQQTQCYHHATSGRYNQQASVERYTYHPSGR